MNESLTLVVPGRPVLEYLPVGLFGAVVGLANMSIAWRLAHLRYEAPMAIAIVSGILAVIAFLALVASYTAKSVTAFAAVRTEFGHPIAGNLFATALISLVGLPILLEPYAKRTAQIMWILGAAGMLLFAWWTVSRWLTGTERTVHATPPWMVPVVGILNVPLALPALELPPLHGLAVLTLAIGLFFAILLFTLIFARLLFEGPLPDGLKPSLLILVAPFAVGYSSYTGMIGQVDLFAQALYMVTLFLFTVLLSQLRSLPRCCPFRVSWWAVSFPMGACCISALRFAGARPSFIADAIGLSLLALMTLMNVFLLGRTLIGIGRGELRNLSA